MDRRKVGMWNYMFERAKLNALNDYFTDYTSRTNQGTYFCRLAAYNKTVDTFLIQYLNEVKKCGVYIKGKIPNPDEKQLNYYEEMMGLDFRMDQSFILSSLMKWLPRLNDLQRESVEKAIFHTLSDMQNAGKTENMLKNAYIKFMCWFYYKFERVLNELGKPGLPKILYEGIVSSYELKILSILAKSGCDILLLEYKGDAEYLCLDPKSEYSNLIQLEGTSFPDNYSINSLLQQRQEEDVQARVRISRPEIIINTNTWLTGNLFGDCLKLQKARGTDSRFFYNMFVHIHGVESKADYLNELLKWKLKLESSGRNVVIIEKSVPAPDAFEVQKIPRKNYSSAAQMIADLQNVLVFKYNNQLEGYIKAAFYDLLMEDKEITLQKLSNRAIMLVCWIKNYIPQLYPDWKLEQCPVLIYYGSCNTLNEAYFIRLLARLPADIFVLCPDLNIKSKLRDKLLFEKTYENSLELGEFPAKVENVKFGTTAYQAEQELNTILYQDTGMYRNRQFKKAMPVTLQTTFEEIHILWKQEAVYRPNFEALDDRVMLPVIFSKVSGVPNGKDSYWKEISDMLDENTILVTRVPYRNGNEPNPLKQSAVNFLINGRLQADKIRNHKDYQYSFMRPEMQDYMLDKLQQLIDMKLIKGSGTNGTEYTAVAAILNLDKQILRLIQKFDFTKSVPKFIIIQAGETICSLEDSIITAYLNLIGFDVVIFVPTGYQSIERYLEHTMLAEHQAGEYMYDLNIPYLKAHKSMKDSFASKLFRRGR